MASGGKGKRRKKRPGSKRRQGEVPSKVRREQADAREAVEQGGRAVEQQRAELEVFKAHADALPAELRNRIPAAERHTAELEAKVARQRAELTAAEPAVRKVLRG